MDDQPASVVDSVGLTASATFAEVVIRSEGSLVGAQVGGSGNRVELRLPDASAAADLEAPPAQALIKDLRLTRTEPGLLVEVETARPVDFEVAGGDGSIRLRLRQKGTAEEESAASVPDVKAPAVPEPAIPEPAVPASAEPLAPQAAELWLTKDRSGDPLRVQGPVSLRPATVLHEVEYASTGSGSGVFLRADGEPEYSAFLLRDPLRLVVDLQGVLDQNGEPSVLLADTFVRTARIAQYKRNPEPVTRIVLELTKHSRARFLRMPDGLLVVFESLSE